MFCINRKVSPLGWLVFGSLFFWGFILYACNVWAGPYLTCDCTPATDVVTGFQIQFGTATPIDVPTFTLCQSLPACGVDQYRICYDLVALPTGPYSIKAAAKNAWGISTQTNPLLGTKAVPSSPSSLRIVP